MVSFFDVRFEGHDLAAHNCTVVGVGFCSELPVVSTSGR